MIKRINKYFFCTLIVFTVLSCKALKKSGSTASDQKKWNVLFIAIDDMNNWIGYNGGPAITPHIDKLASRSVHFTNAHCVVPACNPSRTAIWTGQRPETTGQYENKGNFRLNDGGQQRVTLPQYLQKIGYETIGAGKLFHFARGLQEDANPISDPISWNVQNKANGGITGDKKYLDEYGQAAWLEGALRDEIKLNDSGGYLSKSQEWGYADQKKEESWDWKNAVFIADYLKQGHDKPFFAACGISRPHAPFIAPKEYFDLYPLDKLKAPIRKADDMQDIPDFAQTNFASRFVSLVEEKKQLLPAVQGYLASMSFADACVGEILKGLENSKYKDNTIVVLWSDHGFQLGEKRRWEKYSLWTLATSAPFMVYVPNQKAAITKTQVSYLDLYPTILELLGESIPSYLEGKSFVEVLNKPKSKRTTPAVVTYPKGSHAVIMDNWHYIQYADNSRELYDNDKDPHQFTNLATDFKYSSVMNDLSKHIPK